jgi:hypothetical protein
MDDHFAAGTRAVQVIDPDRRTVAMHSATAPTHRRREGTPSAAPTSSPASRCR